MENLNPKELVSKTNLRIYTDGFKDDICYSFYTSGYNISHFEHYHDYYEVVCYYGEETAAFFHMGKRYDLRYGDIAIINIFEKHFFDFERNAGHSRMSFGVTPQFLMSYSSSDANLFDIFDGSSENYPVLHTNHKRFNKYMDLMLRFENPSVETGIMAFRKSILGEILSHLYEDTYVDHSKSDLSYRNLRLMSDIISYVDLNFYENISLNSLCKKFNYSAPYISKTFKKMSGNTFSRYVTNRRIDYASFLLEGTTPIEEIAAQTGFKDYSHFYRTFKQLKGMSPREYRAQCSDSFNPQ